MNTAQLVAFLKENSSLFQTFEEPALTSIVEGARQVTFEPDEAIIEFAAEGRFFGIIIEGEALVSVTDDNGEVHELSRLLKGDLFGEMALLTGQRTMADVIARTRCRALLFSQTQFAAEIMPNPAAIRILSRILSERSRQLAYDEQRDALRASAAKKSPDPHGFSLRSDTPHRILVINCGSSSLKWRLYDTERPGTCLKGLVERIGQKGTRHTVKGPDVDKRQEIAAADHRAAFNAVTEALTGHGGIGSPLDITAVGHRVVHGGERFTHPVLIDDKVLLDIEAQSPLAPLHNPVNVMGIRLAMERFPSAIHTAVFDTSFHHTLPSYAYLYGLPYKYYADKGVRRFGFHGISHFYVSLKAAHALGAPYNSLEIITCHLGNGSSVCAVDHGRSVDTSMGMTPTAGLLMGTRSGDVDPGVIVHLARSENLDADELDTLVNKKSGLLGLSGRSNDLRELANAAADGDNRALVAIKTFCYQLRKTIGAYVAAMQGLDCVVFTGGIGENSAWVRSLACQGLECMGIDLDEEKNRAACGVDAPRDIAARSSRVRVLVIPTNEELMIARETLKAVERRRAEAHLESSEMDIPIEVSAHHIHLSAEHVAALFGEGHSLTPAQPLSQPGQYACEETVSLVGPKGRVDRVRVLGPERSSTQVEIAMTEQFRLGIHPPIRESGDLDDTPGVRIEGPASAVDIEQGVICAMRHIHMTPEDALRLGLRDRYLVQVVVKGDRELTFGDVVVRVSPKYKLAMHIDTDEANAADLRTGALGRIVGIQGRGGQ